MGPKVQSSLPNKDTLSAATQPHWHFVLFISEGNSKAADSSIIKHWLMFTLPRLRLWPLLCFIPLFYSSLSLEDPDSWHGLFVCRIDALPSFPCPSYFAWEASKWAKFDPFLLSMHGTNQFSESPLISLGDNCYTVNFSQYHHPSILNVISLQVEKN